MDNILTAYTAKNEGKLWLNVKFNADSAFTRHEGIPCRCTNVIADSRQIKINLENKTVMVEAVENLASAHDCGKSLTLRQAKGASPQSMYAYHDDHEYTELRDLSQVTFQIQGSTLLAKFEAGRAAPAVLSMPVSSAPAPVVRNIFA